MSITLQPVAVVHSPRTDRTDDYWGSVESTIELDERFSPEALSGLSEFSHIEVVFLLHGVDESEIETNARRPRNNPRWPKLGIFAQRGARRPNRLGVSRCTLVRIDGRTMYVRGLDANDASPVLDIKPYIREFAPIGEIRQPRWATEVMEAYYRVKEV